MAVTVKVTGKFNSLVHKGSMGFVKSTLPDVCKTPSPGGPVPIPYPVIVSFSRDLKKGTKTVKADGNSAAIKGSEFSRCTGDEPGTVGGVQSSTNMKEATWITYAFDVKLDGKNACRLSDKMMMNHGNTACLGGLTQKELKAIQKARDKLCKEFCKEIRNGWESSRKLEQRLKNSTILNRLGIKITPSIPHVFYGVARRTVPDAALYVGRKLIQCFDLKFPGDRWRNDQWERQTRLARGRTPYEISEETCEC